MKEVKIKTQKTARVYFSSEISKNTKEIIIVCHGYAQLAKYFLKKFECITTVERTVVAPEALNKFYWNGMNGKVVASWMTKEDRESEIEDYIHYLNKVYTQVRKTNKEAKITLFGFSQGTSTICRWLANEELKIKCDRLILWSGSFPEDMLNKEVFKTTKIDYLIGNKDEYISAENKVELIKKLHSYSIQPNFIEFEGGHNIYEKDLIKLMKP